jgi:hypothetical protein
MGGTGSAAVVASANGQNLCPVRLTASLCGSRLAWCCHLNCRRIVGEQESILADSMRSLGSQDSSAWSARSEKEGVFEWDFCSTAFFFFRIDGYYFNEKQKIKSFLFL